jgi:hypothetical protein
MAAPLERYLEACGEVEPWGGFGDPNERDDVARVREATLEAGSGSFAAASWNQLSYHADSAELTALAREAVADARRRVAERRGVALSAPGRLVREYSGADMGNPRAMNGCPSDMVELLYHTNRYDNRSATFPRVGGRERVTTHVVLLYADDFVLSSSGALYEITAQVLEADDEIHEVTEVY